MSVKQYTRERGKTAFFVSFLFLKIEMDNSYALRLRIVLFWIFRFEGDGPVKKIEQVDENKKNGWLIKNKVEGLYKLDDSELGLSEWL